MRCPLPSLSLCIAYFPLTDHLHIFPKPGNKQDKTEKTRALSFSQAHSAPFPPPFSSLLISAPLPLIRHVSPSTHSWRYLIKYTATCISRALLGICALSPSLLSLSFCAVATVRGTICARKKTGPILNLKVTHSNCFVGCERTKYVVWYVAKRRGRGVRTGIR